MKVILLALLLIVGDAAGGKGGGGRGGRRGGGPGGPGAGGPGAGGPGAGAGYGGYGNSPGQGPARPNATNSNNGPPPQAYDYFAPPPPTQNLGGAYLTASPSNSVSAGAMVTLTCNFLSPIYQQAVYFAIGFGDSMEDPDVFMFDTSSVAVGQSMSISNQVAVVVNTGSVSLVFYKAQPTDSGAYQCYIPNVATSNVLSLTVMGKGPMNKTTLIVAITVPLVIVLAIVITLLVLRFRYGYRCYGMQFRRTQPAHRAEIGEVEKKAPGKPDELDPAKLPPYDIATNAPTAYQPPNYDEAVYG